MGRHLSTGQPVCFDVLSWFVRARLPSNPSLGLHGLPGLGKSTLVRRLSIGAAATGAVPLVLGDLRPVLDTGGLDEAAGQLGGLEGERLAEEAHGRRLNLVAALLTVVRPVPLTDVEVTVLSAALRVLVRNFKGSGRRRSRT